MTAPLPERIAAAIDRYGHFERVWACREPGVTLDAVLSARDALVRLFAEVVAERDAAIANTSLPGYCRLVDERDAERARADGLAADLAMLREELGRRIERDMTADELRADLAAAQAKLAALLEKSKACRDWLKGINCYEGDDLDEAVDFDNAVVDGLAQAIAGGEQSFPSDRTGDAMAQHQVDAWLADGQKARADLAAAQAKLAELLAAAKEAEEVLALMERPRIEDPSYGAEVRELGDRIGFGALMSSASASWRKRLEASGGPVGGEHCAGPCHATVLMTLKVVRAAIAAAEQGGA